MAEPDLTISNRYRLKAPPAAFSAAIGCLAARVQAQGHPGVLAYRFYLNAAAMTARAVIAYENAAAWIGHHEIAMAWPEMTALHAAAQLEEVVFLGELTPEIRAWMEKSGMPARIISGNQYVAGFQR